MEQAQKVVKTKRTIKRDYTYAVGRRKEAVARVRLYTHVKEGHVFGSEKVVKDQMLVNEMPIEKYFPGPIAKSHYTQPFSVTNTIGKFAVTVKVAGGGRNGQLDAMIQGLARALSKIDTIKYRKLLKTKGLLTRDSRARQRRQVGMGGKSRRKKQSPKR